MNASRTRDRWVGRQVCVTEAGLRITRSALVSSTAGGGLIARMATFVTTTMSWDRASVGVTDQVEGGIDFGERRMKCAI